MNQTTLSFISNSEEKTREAGFELAKTLKPGDVVTLIGDLGAGKTQFVKGVANSLGLNENVVNSPTFTIINEYNNASIPIYHFDCYRLKTVGELVDIGAEEYLFGNGICCIEWPEIVESLLTESYIQVKISHRKDKKRDIIISKIDP